MSRIASSESIAARFPENLPALRAKDAPNEPVGSS